MTARRARRDGRPAYENAPERLRQSDIPQPFMFLPDVQPGFLARLFGRTTP